MLPLVEYMKIKDNYCISYQGAAKDFLMLLKLLRPSMEAKFPGTQIYISCKDEYTYLFDDEPRIITRSELQERRKQFAYIRELGYKTDENPIEKFMSESGIEIPKICDNSKQNSAAVLLPHGNFPNRSLNHKQIKEVTEYVRSQGCELAINKPHESFKWIISVENEFLYQAASSGKRVTLIPTGIGENLFRSMFPDGEILNLNQ
jgi:hypothetical protein